MTDEPLLPDVKRLTQGRLAWLLLCLLVSSFIWSYAWNPTLFLYDFITNPPENINGTFVMGYVVLGTVGLALFLSVIVGGRAFFDHVRPNYGVLFILLAAAGAGMALIGMASYESIPVVQVSP